MHGLFSSSDTMIYHVDFINVNFITFVKAVNWMRYLKGTNNHDYPLTSMVQHGDITWNSYHNSVFFVKSVYHVTTYIALYKAFPRRGFICLNIGGSHSVTLTRSRTIRMFSLLIVFDNSFTRLDGGQARQWDHGQLT